MKAIVSSLNIICFNKKGLAKIDFEISVGLIDDLLQIVLILPTKEIINFALI